LNENITVTNGDVDNQFHDVLESTHRYSTCKI
jgi:hypothetical protein